MDIAEYHDALREDLAKLAALVVEGEETAESSQAPVLQEGERRNIVIFFLDIKGFTAMSERMELETVRSIIDRCFKLFSREIDRFGGFVEKYMGDAIMALFGSPEAHEDDIERALRASLEILERLKDINQILSRKGIELGLRIGVNYGLVTTGAVGKGRERDFTVMGDAVNLAQRLESNAPVGKVMITRETRDRVGDIFTYERVGEIKVKGKEKPIEVFTVEGVNSDREGAGRRGRLAREARFVGRRGEWEMLHRLFQESCSDPNRKGHRLAGIAGPAGVGKSRLAYEFAFSPEHPLNKETRVLQGKAFLFASTPYMVFATMLKGFFEVTVGDEAGRRKVQERLSSLAEGLASEEAARLTEALPFLGYLMGFPFGEERIARLDPKGLKIEIQIALRRFLEAASGETHRMHGKSVVVVLEDVQGIDAPSLDTLHYLLNTLEAPHPFLWVLCHRPDFDAGRAFGGRPSFRQIALSPLSEAAVSELVESLLPGIRLPEKLRGDIVQKAEGNPLYIEEFIRSAVDQGWIYQEGDRWLCRADIDSFSAPDSLKGLVLQRIDRLDRKVKQVLQQACVIGKEFYEGVLVGVANKLQTPAEEVQGALAVLEGSNLLARRETPAGTQYFFHNAVTVEVTYGTLLNYNRRILHKMAGEVIEEVFADQLESYDAVLAEHFLNSDEEAKASLYALKSLQRMRLNFNFEAALGLSDRALKALTEGRDDPKALTCKVDLLTERSKVLNTLGRRDQEKEAVESCLGIAKGLGDRKRWANGIEVQTDYLLSTGDFAKAKSVVQSALMLRKTSNDEPGEGRAEEKIAHAHYSLSEFDPALEHSQKALELSRKLGDASSELRILNGIGLSYQNMRRFDEAARFYERALELEKTIGNRHMRGYILNNLGIVYKNTGEYQKSLDQCVRVLKIFEEIGDRNAVAFSLGNCANAYRSLGKLDEAQEHLERALSIFLEIGNKFAQGAVYNNLGKIHAARGEWEKAREMQEKGLALGRETKAGVLIVNTQNDLARVLLHLDTEPARARAEEMARTVRELAGKSKNAVAEALALSTLALCRLRAGDAEQASAYASEAMRLIGDSEQEEASEVREAHKTVMRHASCVMRTPGTPDQEKTDSKKQQPA
jgi:class 3 adenylate cyclase/predicted ATPase